MRTARIALKYGLLVLTLAPPMGLLENLGLGVNAAQAADFYVSPLGTSPYTGTLQAPLAYATVVANAASGNVASGTNYLFLSGTYEGTLQIIGLNGTAGAPIIFEAAPGEVPVFSGSRDVGGWTNLGGGLYSTTAIPAGFTKVLNLYDDGVLQTLSRFPNTGFLRPEAPNTLNPITGSLADADLIANPELPANTDLTGSRIVYRYANWGYATGQVFSHAQATGALTFTAVGSGNLFLGNWGYFLTNSLAFLDSEGEWFYDEQNTTLYYRPIGGTTPTNVRLASNLGLYGVEIKTSASQYLTFRGLTFEHYADDLLPSPTNINGYANGLDRGTGIRIRNGGHDYITVEQCTFRELRIGIDDITSVPYSSHATYRANVFHDVYRSGIRSQCTYGTIEDNTFTDIAMIPGQTGHIFQMATGMDIISDAMTVRGNRLINIGGTGLSLGGNKLNMNDPDEHVVEHNYMSGACAVLNDHGGIAFDGCDGLTIRSNVVCNMIPATESSADGDFSSDKTVGIYFGEANPAFGNVITNTTVSGNTITNCATGIVVDNNIDIHDNHVVGNTVFGCRDVQLYFQDYAVRFNAPPYQAAYDTQVEDNILYCLSEEQYCMTQWNTRANTWNQTGTNGNDRQIVDFGDFFGNFYFNPYSRLLIKTSMFLPVNNSDEGRMSSVPRTLDHWQAERGEDLDSYEHPLEQQRFTALTGTNPNLVSNGSFGTNTLGWQYCDAHLPSGPFTGGAMTTTIPGCEWLENNSAQQSIASGTYLLALSTKGLRDGAVKASIQITSNNPDGVWIPITEEGGTVQVLLEQPTTANGYLNLHDIDWWAQNSTTGFPGCMQPVSPYNELIFDEIAMTLCDQVDYLTPEQVAEGHILRYYADLPGIENDPQNVAGTGGTFELIGCWSDVTGQVYSGTVTLAPWESIVLYRLQDQFDIDVAQYDVQGSETWNTDKRVRGSVVIGNGEALTIDGATISFADSRQDEEVLTNIVVEAGGTLELINGAHLTTLPTCGANSMWDGVKNYGNVDPSAPQGMVRVHSGSRISNSLTGILGGEGDPLDPGYAGPIKNGLIDIRDAFFENNRYDVVLHGLPSGAFFLDYWDVPFFQSTTFSTTAHLNYDDLDPVAHVRVADHGQSIFLGCTFANDLPTHTQSHLMGLGIQGLNANIAVWGQGPGSSVFRNLDHAIHNLASAGAPYTNVVLSEFIDNICAVYMADVPGFAIRGNTVQMGRWSSVELTGDFDPAFLLHQRGLFATGSNAFSIMDNTLSRSAGNTTLLEGIVVGYTGAENEVVFRNNAADLDLAYVGEGECADVNGDPSLQGLQFQCNTNTSNAVNIKSRSANGDQANAYLHTIRGRQGTPTYSASNAFDGAQHFVVDTRADALAYLEYSHVGGDAPATYTVQNLNDPDADYLVPVQVSTVITCGTGEPVWIAGGGQTFTEVKPNLTASKYEYGNLRYLYDQLIDGGSTDEVVEEITSAWPQDVWDLRTYLLSLSPNLSVEALKQLVNKAYVPIAVKAEILIANPDATKKEGFLRWAEYEANYPIPGYVADAIEASWDTRTYRTTLEESIADKHTRLTQLAAHAIHLLQTDTVPPPPDSLRWVWQQVRTNRARYSEAALLLGLGDHAGAQAIVEAMPAEREPKAPEEQERQRMLTYIDVLRTAADDDRNHYQLSPAEVTELETMVGTHYDRPSNWASNLLCAAYGKCRAPYTGDVAIPKVNRTRERSAELTLADASAYGLQPNPARNWVTFSYDSSNDNADAGRIVVRALDGRMVTTLMMNGAQGQQIWDTRAMAPGTYLVQYLRGEEVVHTEKLIIQQ